MRQERLYSPDFFGPAERGTNSAPLRRLEGKSAPDMANLAEVDRLNGLLVRVARHRDRQAFIDLFHHFAPRLKSFLQRGGVEPGTAEEIVQDVMVTVWRRADGFDPTVAAAGTWIFAIARNRRIDRLRQERRPEIDPDDPALVPDDPAPPDAGLLVREETARLHRAIRDLPPEQADLLRMAYFQDKAHSVIASECNLPLGTVKSRLRLALARLRGALHLAGETP